MRTSNPALNDKVFQARSTSATDRMTISGTVNKSFLLIGIVFLTAIWSWQQAFPGGWSIGVTPTIPVWYLPSAIIGFILGIVIVFKPTASPILVPIYAALEGIILGAVSALFEAKYPGVVMQAVLGTMGTFIALLTAYRSQLIRATENFKLGVVAATGGIALVYLMEIVLRMFGINMPFINDSGPMGIMVSIVIVVIAALNLVLDFDFIEKGAEHGAPKYMEWYASFGLLVTLIWLYLEILRLLAKTRKR
ncbi:MAG: Bax inhibitor-1/YccA family protein [Pseudomonadota bacterium]|nr:Bax inhibitor-1/YccA family protein [Pseudomonadota bacterium]